MGRAFAWWVVFAVVCAGFLGCGEEPQDRKMELAAQARETILQLKAERLALEDTMAQLNSQLDSIRDKISFLERVHNELYQVEEKIHFWEDFEWAKYQAPVALALVLLVWLLYRAWHRKKKTAPPKTETE
ncbi:MAG: hypothetical protein JRI97_08760 [Deltaproteobacteria bacterium]|nr:hypothetical protein [Deltaproteobacteria bacterium]